MRHLIATLILLIVTGCVMAQPAPAAPAGKPAPEAAAGALSPDSPIDQILDALDARGEGLTDFTADVQLAEADQVTGEDPTTRSGKVWYQLKGNQDARIRVAFDTRERGNKVEQQKLEYLLNDGWLVDRSYNKKTEVRRQVLRPGEKINLLKLGEGPFPLPIGQDKESVRAMFDVTKPEPGSTDPAGTVHLTLTPKPDSQFAKRFQAIDVWVDVQSHFPRRIETLDAQGTAIRTTDLENIRINTNLTDADFALPEINAAEWTRHTEPYAE